MWLDSVLCTSCKAQEGSRKEQVCLASSLGLVNGLGQSEGGAQPWTIRGLSEYEFCI